MNAVKILVVIVTALNTYESKNMTSGIDQDLHYLKGTNANIELTEYNEDSIQKLKLNSIVNNIEPSFLHQKGHKIVERNIKDIINKENTNSETFNQDTVNEPYNYYILKKEQAEQDELLHLSYEQNESVTKRKSKRPLACFICDNVQTPHCANIAEHFIATVDCDRSQDMCYTMHTPFGIIKRGCFNVNENIVTHVCSCNLCNYQSISDMPQMFLRKKDWVENIVELTKSRRLRKSISQGMKCLKCEVNSTTKIDDMLHSADCLEGKIGSLPVEMCSEDEVCAVRAVKRSGYIWRGCTQFPLYNYWWSLCNTNNCNSDDLVTFFNVLD